MQSVKVARTLVPLLSAFGASGRKKSQGYADIQRGVFPPPVKLGKRSVVPSDELQAVVDAHIAGQTEDEIRSLVARLHAARREAVAA